jgi:hypothetical protein
MSESKSMAGMNPHEISDFCFEYALGLNEHVAKAVRRYFSGTRITALCDELIEPAALSLQESGTNAATVARRACSTEKLLPVELL